MTVENQPRPPVTLEPFQPPKRRRGRPKNEERTVVQNVSVSGKRVGVRMKSSLLAELRAFARREGCSVSELLRLCGSLLVECTVPAMVPHIRNALKEGRGE